MKRRAGVGASAEPNTRSQEKPNIWLQTEGPEADADAEALTHTSTSEKIPLMKQAIARAVNLDAVIALLVAPSER